MGDGWTAFDARHGCGETLRYNGAPVFVSIEVSGGLTQSVKLTTEQGRGAPSIPDDAELECPCGKLTAGRTSGEAGEHFERASRRWDREHPPEAVATGRGGRVMADQSKLLEGALRVFEREMGEKFGRGGRTYRALEAAVLAIEAAAVEGERERLREAVDHLPCDCSANGLPPESHAPECQVGVGFALLAALDSPKGRP